VSDPRVAVITPYYREPVEFLRAAHDSVRRQTYPTTHFVVADGAPRDEVRGWPVEHIVLPRNHGDFGDTPHALGAISALSLGYDAIAFLDSDNWYLPNHVETMVAAQRRSGHPVVLAARSFHRLDGSLMAGLRDEENHADTNCLFLSGEAARLVPLLAIKPKAFAEVGDRIFWRALRQRGVPFIRVMIPTVAYRTPYKAHYQAIGETPPPGAKDTAGAKFRAWMAAASESEKSSWSAYLFGAPDRW